MLPVSRMTHGFYLENANMNKDIYWDFNNNWNENYKMRDLSPRSFHELAQKVKLDNLFCYLFKRYEERYVPYREYCTEQEMIEKYC